MRCGRYRLASCLVALLAQRAAADQAIPPEEPRAAEIEAAISADQQAKDKTTDAPAAASTTRAFDAAVARLYRAFDLDIGTILNVAAGYYSQDDATLKSGDDPGQTGFNVQELELALQAVVDPYFRADVFLAIPNLSGLEVEEALLTTTHLPWSFQLKAGIFRAALGRQNTQHLHAQDFVRRPATNALFLGIDGLRAPGLELNWLVPGLPFYLLLAASAFSVGPAAPDLPLATFGGGDRWDFAYVGSAKAFFPLGESTSLYLGLSYARGKTSQQVTRPTTSTDGSITVNSVAPTAFDAQGANLYGADLYLKWKPTNVTRTYASVAWQTEYFLRHIPGFFLGGLPRTELEGGLYSQVVVQAARRWFFGLRGELLGIPSGDNVHREYAGAAAITWALSEFSHLRLYGETRLADGAPLSGAAFLQFQIAFGAHGAHPF